MSRVLQLILLMLIIPASSLAQLSQLKIVDKPEKWEAPISEVRDINSRICAVIQVISEMEGFMYDSYQGVVKVIDLQGKDMVFLSPDERVLEIYHSGYQPLKIIFSEIGLRLKGKGNKGWKITLTGEKKLSQVPILIDIYPDSVTVIIDDNDYGIGKLFMATEGKHKIQLNKNGFSTILDSIEVNKKTNQFKFVLAPQLEMVFVTGGTFDMGNTYERPVHKVKVNDFFMAKYEVTFVAYDAYCEETGKIKPNDEGWGRGKHPIINVRWYAAIEFCNWLSEKHGFTQVYRIDRRLEDLDNKNRFDDVKWTVTRDFNANGYRLPTEAEWEYACRGGLLSAHFENSGSNNADAVAWYKNNSSKRTHTVGTKQSNELGLHDMSGNVSEWCGDWYDKNYYSKSPYENPAGPVSGNYRVQRGGSFYVYDYLVKCAKRNYLSLNSDNKSVGFRLVRSVK